MRRLALAALVLAPTCCRADPEPPAQPVTSSTLPAASSVVPPAAPVGARRDARRLFTAATLEPDRKKARALFLEAAEVLPPGGPALYQAGRMATGDGDAEEARRLFDRALAAIERSTHQKPKLAPMRVSGRIKGLAAGAGGHLVLVSEEGGTVVRDAFGWLPRFDHDTPPSAAALSEDGTRVVTATGERLLSCSLVEAACAAANAPAAIGGLALSGDGDTLAARIDDGAVEIRDAATLARRLTFRPQQGKASAALLSATGDRLFVGLDSGAVLRVRADTGAVEGTRGGHETRVIALARDAGGRTLVSADTRSIRSGAPDAAEGETLLRLPADDEGSIEGIALGSDPRTLFVERAKHVETWSLTKKERILAAEPGGYYPLMDPPRVATAPGRIYVGTYQAMGKVGWRGIDVYDLRDPLELERPIERLPGGMRWHSGTRPQAGLLGAGATLAIYEASSCDTAVWDVARGAFVRAWQPSAQGYCPGHRLSADGATLFAPSNGSNDFVALDVATGSVTPLDGGRDLLTEPLPPHAPAGTRVAALAAGVLAWIDDQDVVHAGPSAGPFRALGKRLPAARSRHASDDPEPGLAISPKGTRIAFRTAADRAEIWAPDGERPVHVVRRPGISSVAFGADETAFVGALDGTVTMIRAGVERVLFTPEGAPVFGLAALRDGRLIAVAVVAQNAVIHLWSARDGAHRATLTSVEGGAFAATPDGKAEVFEKAEGELDCHLGPFVFSLDLCRARIERGLLARAVDLDRTDP